MEQPKCKLCGGRHWGYEPHIGVVTPSRKFVASQGSVTVQGNGVTPKRNVVTVQGNGLKFEKHCPTCRCDRRKHGSKAAKQRAYRERKGLKVS